MSAFFYISILFFLIGKTIVLIDHPVYKIIEKNLEFIIALKLICLLFSVSMVGVIILAKKIPFSLLRKFKNGSLNLVLKVGFSSMKLRLISDLTATD